ncbi:hypothetical protein JSQ81_15410 [Sporosarcina sp. Marseille-Q4063]|uniref:hypothetical protein n=1 Tax=Sporosarcina sp. Marseille-Q4063 TaxID=2810514 RepID=UPI001BAFEEBD|nr:hypothetical protein [Sporosarcina sp. Marseille-Q4063]QUW21184.1 hypothetical protein JSQ81_15410 [Sporosarcina sp. Marseille-Q4063]
MGLETTNEFSQTTKVAVETTNEFSQTTKVAVETTIARLQTTKVSKKENQSALFVEAGTNYERNTYRLVQISKRIQTIKIAGEATKIKKNFEVENPYSSTRFYSIR